MEKILVTKNNVFFIIAVIFFFFFPKKIVFSPEKHQPQGQSGPWTRDINVNGVALLDLIRWWSKFELVQRIRPRSTNHVIVKAFGKIQIIQWCILQGLSLAQGYHAQSQPYKEERDLPIEHKLVLIHFANKTVIVCTKALYSIKNVLQYCYTLFGLLCLTKYMIHLIFGLFYLQLRNNFHDRCNFPFQGPEAFPIPSNRLRPCDDGQYLDTKGQGQQGLPLA